MMASLLISINILCITMLQDPCEFIVELKPNIISINYAEFHLITLDERWECYFGSHEIYIINDPFKYKFLGYQSHCITFKSIDLNDLVSCVIYIPASNNFMKRIINHFGPPSTKLTLSANQFSLDSAISKLSSVSDVWETSACSMFITEKMIKLDSRAKKKYYRVRIVINNK